LGEVATFKRPDGLPVAWADYSLVAAVKAHVFGGDVGAILGISEPEVKYWTRTYQWQQITQEVLPEVKKVLQAQMLRIGSQALDQLGERIRTGDPVINLDGSPKLTVDGEQVYRPLKAKDLADIGTKVMAEQRALEAKIGPIVDDEGRISLELLSKGLARYATAKEIIGEAVVTQ